MAARPRSVRLQRRLGRRVGIQRIPDAIHDVFLSGPAARTAAYAALEAWLLTGAVPRAI